MERTDHSKEWMSYSREWADHSGEWMSYSRERTTHSEEWMSYSREWMIHSEGKTPDLMVRMCHFVSGTAPTRRSI